MGNLKYFIILVCCLNGLLAEDYCAIVSCPNNTHIGCGATDDFKPTCPSGVTFVDLNAYADLIADDHSKFRQALANGIIPGLPKAANLCEVKYDAELAKIAKYNVLKCQFAHDCRSTARFPYMGQNIYWSGDSTFIGTETQIQQQIRGAIYRWFNEYQNASPEQLLSYPMVSPPPSEVIGHFTVMANYKSCLVGCAMYYISNNMLQITCNYSYTNMLGRRTYVPTDTPGSSCNTISTKYPGLCGNEEHTNFNFANDD